MSRLAGVCGLTTHYGSSEHDNVTTPDGFFVAQRSILALKLTLGATTSLDQVAKYLLLFALEEKLTGRRDHLSLVYVFSRAPEDTFRKQTGIAASAFNPNTFEVLLASTRNGAVRALLEQHAYGANDCLSRLNIHCISWQALVRELTNFSERFRSGSGIGDRTLTRLIDGVITEIRRHPLSNVERAETLVGD